MKEIPLTQGMTAIVDDEDYERLVRWKWRCGKSSQSKTGYAVRNKTLPSGKRGIILMHRVILNTPLDYDTDHTNGNGLDNRKENLRVATHTQNMQNRGKGKNNTSGYKGVFGHKNTKKWRAIIQIENKHIFLGYFKDKLEAARAYNEAAIKLHGEFACLNQVGD